MVASILSCDNWRRCKAGNGGGGAGGETEEAFAEDLLRELVLGPMALPGEPGWESTEEWLDPRVY